MKMSSTLKFPMFLLFLKNLIETFKILKNLLQIYVFNAIMFYKGNYKVLHTGSWKFCFI